MGRKIKMGRLHLLYVIGRLVLALIHKVKNGSNGFCCVVILGYAGSGSVLTDSCQPQPIVSVNEQFQHQPMKII
jgi:hypothetical protein